MLERIKQTLLTWLPVPGEALLVVAGVGCFLATCAVARKPPSWPWALVPGLVLSLVLEGWEIVDHWGPAGLASRGEWVGIALRHGADLLRVNLLPALIFLAARWMERGAS